MKSDKRNSQLCPNCRRLISADEQRCPYCGIQAPGSVWKNNPVIRNWGTGEQLIRWIVYANIAMFLLSLVINPQHMRVGLNPFTLLSPSGNSLAVLGATGTWMMSRASGWWTLISANYLHGSVLHILFNMLALYQISPLIAQLYGPYRYFLIYTFSGAIGFLLSYMAGVPMTIGASAALCGLIGSALYYGKSRGGLYGQAVYKQVGGWAVVIIIFGFLVPGINNYAHIGGILGGTLTALLVGYHEKSRETLVHRSAAGLCMVVTALVLLWSILRGARALFGI